MAVAEIVAAGAVPSVPDNGGQRDVVDRRADLLYTTPAEAIGKIDRVLSDPKLRRDVRLDPDVVKVQFSRDRFREVIRTLARELLDGADTTRPLERIECPDSRIHLREAEGFA